MILVNLRSLAMVEKILSIVEKMDDWDKDNLSAIN